MLHKADVREALAKVDKNIQKLDTGIQTTFERLNQPLGKLTIAEVTDRLCAFEGKVIIQTLFVRGHHNGFFIDNTTTEELDAWLPLVRRINPEYVMIYPIDRGTPAKDLEKITPEELKEIALKVEAAGIRTEVFY
jgi:wyosine [tRNA(Phe)-imidazoG37] synthetase (radical SAM superfamily)